MRPEDVSPVAGAPAGAGRASITPSAFSNCFSLLRAPSDLKEGRTMVANYGRNERDEREAEWRKERREIGCER